MTKTIREILVEIAVGNYTDGNGNPIEHWIDQAEAEIKALMDEEELVKKKKSNDSDACLQAYDEGL